MRSPLEPLFRAAYAAFRLVRWAFRFADLNVSVVWAAVRYTVVSVLVLLLVIFIECWTVSWVSQCLFPPERVTLFVAVRDLLPAIRELILDFPVLWAFALFVAGQAAVAYLAFTTAHWVLTFKLTYVLGSDKYGPEGAYTPFDGDSSESSDTLTF